MADNIDVTPGTGKTIAADEIGGALHQRIKVTWGPDGTGNESDTASGKAFPIQIRSATGLVPIGEPTDDKSTATDTTSVSLISLVKQLSAYLGTLAGAVGSSKVATKAAAADFADGAIATLGLKADAKSTATDTTSITVMQVIKQISASIQAAAASLAGTLIVGHGKTIKTVSGSLTADTDVIPLVSSKRIKVIAYSLISTGVNANAAIFKSNGTSGTELWRVILQAPAASSVFGANLSIPAPSFLFATVAGEKLTLDVGNSDTIHYSITYFDDDAT